MRIQTITLCLSLCLLVLACEDEVTSPAVTGTILGKITRRDTSITLEGAAAYTIPPTRSTTSGPDGDYTLENVLPVLLPENRCGRTVAMNVPRRIEDMNTVL